MPATGDPYDVSVSRAAAATFASRSAADCLAATIWAVI
jgi:hypothetical protein